MSNSINNFNAGYQAPDVSKMNKQELEDARKNAADNGKWDLVGKYSEALSNLEKNDTSLDKVNFSKMSKEEIKDFVKRQMAAIHNTTDQTAKDAKEQELENLINQLNDANNTNTKLLTDTSSVLEQFTFSGRRNKSILKNIKNLESDSANYPKNILIYAMGITSSKYFSMGQSLKRGRAKLTWNWKADNIKENIQNLLEKCQIHSGDSEWKKAIKSTIQAAVSKAKDTYLRKLQIQNSF